jgi:hypothetical protein
MPFCFRFEEDFRGADVKVEENKASVRVFWIYPSGLPRVLAAAIQAKPDWLLSDIQHISIRRVSTRTGLRIATPAGFLMLRGKSL